MADPLNVCFVCTGNICRSPMAEAVFLELAAAARLDDGSVLGDHVGVSSAGTGGWHAGEPMDPRARAALECRGYAGDGHRAQAFVSRFFAVTDLVVCMDRGHRQTLLGLARSDAGDDRYEERLVMLRAFDRAAGGAVDVPDPYYGDEDDFERCLDQVESGCRALVAHLVERMDTSPAPGARTPPP